MKRMQKSMAAVFWAFLSLCILLFINNYYCETKTINNCSSFNSSGYTTTYDWQTFRVKPHDRSWTLSSVAKYNADGKLQWEQRYYLDSEGNSYYMNGDRQQFVSQYPRKGFGNITTYLTDFQLSEEVYDEYDRVVFREGMHPSMPEHLERAEWYYCPNSETDEPSTISVFARTMISVSKDGITPVCYGENEEPLLEYCTYEITNYDRYGNETRVWADGKCFIETDDSGYLEAIVEEKAGTYRVIRVDDSGKPSWIGVYHKETLNLISYIIYQYKPI